MELKEFFKQHNKVAVAFSGGTDSAYLLYEALKNKALAEAYYVSSAFQPEFEREDAKRFCGELGVKLNIVDVDILSCDDVIKNPPDRCYYCKQQIMGNIIKHAKADGFDILVDGTNASDDVNDRPGMKALEELNVLSPLKLCGITKAQVRERSKAAGLFTWDKPAYACLATRIQPGIPIDAGMLKKVEQAENIMRTMGFTDFRVRVFHGMARIQVKSSQMQKVLEHRQAIVKDVGALFDGVFLDLNERA